MKGSLIRQKPRVSLMGQKVCCPFKAEQWSSRSCFFFFFNLFFQIMMSDSLCCASYSHFNLQIGAEPPFYLDAIILNVYSDKLG